MQNHGINLKIAKVVFLYYFEKEGSNIYRKHHLQKRQIVVYHMGYPASLSSI